MQERAGTDAFAETREVIQKFLVGKDGGLFSGIIDELAAHGACSGKFANANIPRGCPFQRGQKRLELIGIPGIVKWLQTFGPRCDPKGQPDDILTFLCSRHVTIENNLKPELRYRGITVPSTSTKKSDLAAAIVKHVLSNLDGYVNKVDGSRMPWQPCGFTGPKPSPKPTDAPTDVRE